MKPDSPHREDDSRVAEHLRDALEQALKTSLKAGVEGGSEGMNPPAIPDHELVRRIGQGAYGDIWLARSALGTLRAVKVIYRARFKEERPFEREFHGILKYEPVSRSHEGLVQVLHVGRGEGCFYYIMELADAAERVAGKEGAAKESGSSGAGGEMYEPRTLKSELGGRPRIPAREVALLMVQLAGALAHLHGHGLVHRDLKPSNVIFVGGKPKLADIGLVTDVGSSTSFVGTEGFIPPEGPGTPQADLYGLGKMLYELVTGMDRMEFPQLPKLEVVGGEIEELMELNEVMTRACALDPRERHATALEFQADLNLFLAGRSLRQTRVMERALRRVRKLALVACVFLALATVVVVVTTGEERHAQERARLEKASRIQESALRERAEAAERLAQQQLRAALLDQARAMVRSGELGQRVQTLDALSRAAALSNSMDLGQVAMAALALPDLKGQREIRIRRDEFEPRLDPAFERLALSRGRGPVEIRSAVGSDPALLVSLPAATNLMVYVRRWSADGRFLAVKRDHPDGGITADWEVWDLADLKAVRRVLWLRGMHRDSFCFHPTLPRCVATHAKEGLGIWSLADGKEVARVDRWKRAYVLRYSPDGSRLAMMSAGAEGMRVSILDATQPELPELWKTDGLPETHMMEWHPGGGWLVAVGNGVHWMDAGTGEIGLMGKHKANAVRAEFSPDGRWLFTGGWERELICWDARERRKALGVNLESYLLQWSGDGKRCAVTTETNILVHTFEAPRSHREFVEDLGGMLRQAAFSADGRWLAASGSEGLGVWDLSRDVTGAWTKEGANMRPYFVGDGSVLLGTKTPEWAPDGMRWDIRLLGQASEVPTLVRRAWSMPRGFTSLAGVSNRVVINTSRASGVFEVREVDEVDWKEEMGRVAMPTEGGICGISPDGRWMTVYRSYGTRLHVYELPELTLVKEIAFPMSIGTVRFSPGGEEMALGSNSGGGRIEFYSTSTWERTRVLTPFGRLLYAPDGKGIWLTMGERHAGLYDARTFKPRMLLPVGTLPLALSADGKKLAVSVEAQQLQLWDMDALREEFRILGLPVEGW